MATSDSKRIAKLRNNNYYAWSYQMEMRLRKLGVWEIVDGTELRPSGSDNTKVVKAWKSRNDLALSEIVTEVEDGQLVHTRFSRDPDIVWAKLKEVHNSQGLGSVISTWQRLFQIRKAPTTSIQEHASTMRKLADRLTNLGDQPSDSLLVAVLMLSLPESYSTLAISLDTVSTNLKNNFAYVVQRCMNEESHQIAVQGVPTPTTETVAFAATFKPRRDRKDITCFKCHRKGHYENECGNYPPAPAAAMSASHSDLTRNDPNISEW